MNDINRKNDPARILIVDDHWVVREGLGRLIEREEGLLLCGIAANASEAYREIENGFFDLAIVDISLNGINGLQITEKITKMCSNTAILILSMHDEPFYVKRAFDAGASGYVAKDESAEMLIEAIGALLAGKQFVSSKIAGKMREVSVSSS